MHRPVARLWFCLLLAACGGGAAGGASHARRAAGRVLDDAVELATALPPGGDRCAVARMGAVPDRRRGLLLRLSQADPVGWIPGGPFVAQAGVERTDIDDGRSAVWLFRLSAPPERVRELLDRSAPVRIAWAGEQGDWRHRVRARFLDDRTLRLERGRWVDGADGAETRCVALATEFPEAVEVASRHGEVMVFGQVAHMPERIDTIILSDAQHVAVTRRHHMSNERQARARDGEGAFPDLVGPMAGLLWDEAELRREGRVLVTRSRILWEDLALAAEDQRRLMAAAREDERRNRPRMAGDIDLTNLAVVSHQRRLWAEAVGASRGTRRSEAARELRAILEGALAIHPRELDLARELGALLVEELSDGAAAAALASDVLTRSPSEPEEWRLLRREGLATVGAEALREALVDDGIVAAPRAAAAAEALASARGRGVAYTFAESAWLAADELLGRAGHMRLRPTTAARLPLISLFDTLLVLAAVGDTPLPGAAVYIFARGRARPWAAVAWHPEDAPVMRLDAPGDTGLWVGAATASRDPRTRQVARTLSEVLESGPVELSVFVVPFDAPPSRPLHAWRLSGEIDRDDFVISAAAGAAARVRWDRVARYLGAPLASLEPRVFPPPELEVEAEGVEEVQGLLELSPAEVGIGCTAAELRVTCVESPDQAGAGLSLLRRFAEERLVAEARRLRGRR